MDTHTQIYIYILLSISARNVGGVQHRQVRYFHIVLRLYKSGVFILSCVRIRHSEVSLSPFC